MPIKVVCPACGSEFVVADGYWGKKVRCKSCAGAIPVGEAPAPQAAEPRPRRRPAAEEGPDAPGGVSLLLIIFGMAALALLLGTVVIIVGVAWWRKPKLPVAPIPPAQIVPGVPAIEEPIWPEPPPLGGPHGYPPEKVVVLRISGVVDDATGEAINDRLEKLVDPGGGHARASSRSGERMVVRLAPVSDVQEFARRIDFGKVGVVVGRTVTIVARKLEAPPRRRRP